MTRVGILGAGGRMGGALIRCLAAADGLELAGAVETPGHAAVGTDAGTSAGLAPLGLAITADPAGVAAADVLIDFTFHTAAPVHARLARGKGQALVLGTTGLSDAEAASVREAASAIPVVWAPNMSLGMNLIFAFARQAAAVLDESYDVEIVEAHHRHKKDAPSGTALGLARQVADGRGQRLDEIACYGREGIIGERPRGQLGIHAVRGGDIVGDHRLMFVTDGETVELAHRASSRECLARGALHAARWAHGREPGLYSMQDVLGL